MTLTLDKDLLGNTLQIVQKFTSDRINTVQTLQGIYVVLDKKHMHLYATDLNVYSHASIPLISAEKTAFIIEPKKILEFIQFLQSGEITITVTENSITIIQGKTTGVFPIAHADEFPLPPKITEEEQTIPSEFFTKHLPFILFTASKDDARPVLTGINISTTPDGVVMVSTDGFRLSVVIEKSNATFPSVIIPASFLQEILKFMQSEKQVSFRFSEKEQIISFTFKGMEFCSRIIEGEFPPYNRVIPTETTTTTKIKKSELLRNTKLISIFAREHSNVIVYTFSPEGLLLSPKKEANAENSTTQDIEFKGEPLKVAFNYKYVIDLLNHIEGDDVEIQLSRSDAPVLFKVPQNPAFMHVIMPVRLSE